MMIFGKNNTSKVHSLIMEQIKDVEGCMASFEDFLQASVNPDTTQESLRALSNAVHQMENAADRSLRAMIDSLSGAFLPSSREELISIATSCDKVANKCEHIALMTVYQRFRFPAQYAGDVIDIIQTSRKQFALLEKSISLLFSRFGDLLEDHAILDEIRAFESHVDTVEDRLYEQVFSMDLDLAHQMQISQFVGELADISDIIENIADKIQIMLITRKA